VTFCDENLPTLLVHAEPAVTELLVARRLQPLLALSGARRLKFGRLLSAWLECGGSQAELAESMSTHRQTLHYRVGRLQAMFGAQLRDPDARVEILLALRAVLPSWEKEIAPR
jgi:DNA-binding PucR family transcriptional regulator